jgi:hypothetical protein
LLGKRSGQRICSTRRGSRLARCRRHHCAEFRKFSPRVYVQRASRNYGGGPHGVTICAFARIDGAGARSWSAIDASA